MNFLSSFCDLEIDEPVPRSSATKDALFGDTEDDDPSTYPTGSWFMSDPPYPPMISAIWDDFSILEKRAGYFSAKNYHAEAYDTYSKMLTDFEHKDSRRLSILDALLHEALQCSPEDPRWQKIWETYAEFITVTPRTFGEQINGWSTMLAVVEGCPGVEIVDAVEHLRAVIYLCTLLECGRHWMAFCEVSEDLVPKNSKLFLCARLRSFLLLKNEFPPGNNTKTTERDLQRRLVKLKSEIIAGFTQKQIQESTLAFCADLLPRADRAALRDPDTSSYTRTEPPPHACKLDSFTKTPDELAVIIRHFVDKFRILFDDLPGLEQKLLGE